MTACDEQGGDGGEADAGRVRTMFAASEPITALPKNMWSAVAPEGTSCGNGAQYFFLVYRGDPTRAVFSMSGGGACWDEQSCAFDSSIVESMLGTVDQFARATRTAGILDNNNANNPLAGATQIYLPSCTGDIFIGDADADYGSAGTYRHRGARNFRAALDWMEQNVQGIESLGLLGCSAGGYGIVFHGEEVFSRYPDVPRKFVFSDSAVGYVEDAWFQLVFGEWNAQLPEWAQDKPSLEVTMGAAFAHFGEAWPNVPIAAFGSYDDRIQYSYYAASGGTKTGAEYSAENVRIFQDRARANPSFRYFMPQGTEHCTIFSPIFYSSFVNSDETLLRDWLGQIVNGELPENRACRDCLPAAAE